MKTDKFYKYAFLLAAAYIVVFLLMPGKKDEPAPTPTSGSGAVVLESTGETFHPGEAAKVRLKNTLPSVEGSPEANLVTIDGLCSASSVSLRRDGQPVDMRSVLDRMTACPSDTIQVKAGEEGTLTLDYLHTSLSTPGWYELALTASDAAGVRYPLTASFSVENRGFLGRMWDLLFYQPLYNLLILLVSVLPGYDLGWAIILLTIIIRLILLIPNQKALESQKKLQLVQPKIAEIQEKYKGDTKKIGEETMKLWKENGVNPMGSCLPLLLQMPFLIALYYAVSHGLELSSTHYLYEPLKGFAVSAVNSNFLGVLDLSKPNIYILPVLLVVLQWYQMHLTVGRSAKEASKKAVSTEAKPDPNKAMNQAMKYVMPLVIGVMSISFPAGVAVYWGMSTLFGIAQQLWVNKMTPSTLK